MTPLIDEWRAELAQRWQRPVAMSGSGSALFAYFLDIAEAQEAIDEAPPGARAAAVAEPVGFGWAASADGDDYWSAGPLGARWRDVARTHGAADGTPPR